MSWVTGGYGVQGSFDTPFATRGLGLFQIGKAGYMLFTWAARKLGMEL